MTGDVTFRKHIYRTLNIDTEHTIYNNESFCVMTCTKSIEFTLHFRHQIVAHFSL